MTQEVEFPEVAPADESLVPSATTSLDEDVDKMELGEEEVQPAKREQRDESTSVAVDSPPHRVDAGDNDESGSSADGVGAPLEAVPLQMAPPLGCSSFGGIALAEDFRSEEIDDRR